jgi:hydroxyacylglutathione hydrolase
MKASRIVFFVTLSLVAVGGGGLAGFLGVRGKADPAFEIKPGLYGVKSGGGIYLFGLRSGNGVTLIDTGADPQGKPIAALLGPMGTTPDQVHDIFLTHGHFDHIQGALKFPTAKIHLGLADVGLAAGTTPPEAIVTKLLTLAMRGTPLKISDPISNRQTFPVGDGKSITAIPVPGHTPGSYAFLYDGALFAGDTMIFKEGRLEPTPSLFDARPEENRAAIRSLKTQLVADTVETVCTAHGGCTPKGLGRNLLDELITRVGG